jgi:uncharacterized protein (TIGR02145 family)
MKTLEDYNEDMEKYVRSTVIGYFVYDYYGDNIIDARTHGNFGNYGVLYSWAAARNACPEGWHLPSDNDWKELEKFLGMNETDLDVQGSNPRNSGDVGKKLKSSSGWTNEMNGDNSSKFNALPAGILGDGEFAGQGRRTVFWSSTYTNLSNPGFRVLDMDYDGVGRRLLTEADSLLYYIAVSTRCIKDD